MRKNTLSLKKSVFIRLCIITLAVMLTFYAIGLFINVLGIRNVRNNQQATLEMNAEFIADELQADLEKLNFFLLELMSDRQLARYAIAYDYLNAYERLSYIKELSAQEYMIKRSSNLAQSVQIMLPRQHRTIITDQSLYTALDEEALDALLALSEKGSVVVREWNGNLWMLLPRYDRTNPLFMLAISISPEGLLDRLRHLGDERTDGMLLLRADGTVFAGTEEGMAIFGSGDEKQERSMFVTEKKLPLTGFTLRCYSRVNEQLKPFVQFHGTLWILTLLTLILLSVYLLYYRAYILRPLNDIFDTMSHAQSNGHYRITSEKATEYDDIYAQFNSMVEHIEALAGQVYEEQYRAQKAELKQLQMQIDPHFLYNSLYLIYRMARAEGQESIASISQNLSNYYRYITKMPEQIVLLQDEISHVMNYLEIQRIRFEPRVHIEVEPLPEEIARERIPSLIIQPIVENAFQHGVKDRTDGGLVSMRYRYTDDAFQVIVADNSGKMNEERLAELWERVRSGGDDSGASALRNLYRRLQLYEHNESGLELRCVDDGLTVVLTFRRKGEVS